MDVRTTVGWHKNANGSYELRLSQLRADGEYYLNFDDGRWERVSDGRSAVVIEDRFRARENVRLTTNGTDFVGPRWQEEAVA